MKKQDIPKLKDGDEIRCFIPPCTGERIVKVTVNKRVCGCKHYTHEGVSCFFAHDGRGCSLSGQLQFYGQADDSLIERIDSNEQR